MKARARRVMLLSALVVSAACSPGAAGPRRDAGAAGAAGGGAGATGGASAGGTSGGTLGGSGGAGGGGGDHLDAGATGGGGGGAAGGATAGTRGDGAAGATGVGGAGGAGGFGGGTVTSGAGGGVFVMCDDHADFNGRGLCSPAGKYGAVVATQTLSAGAALTTLTASFGAAKPATDPGCTQEDAGAACVAVTCPRAGAKNPAGPEAGPITAKSSGGTIVTKPDGTGSYDVAGFASALWTTPKAALTFTAAGGGLPTFSETFCGPVSATITKPAAAPGPALTIDRATDLAVQWTGGAVGDLELLLRDDGGAGATSLEVRCFFTGASGQGTVPKAALAKLSAGTHAIASYIWVRKIGGAGGTCVELTGVNTNVSASGGAPFNGRATLQ